ncbi:MAG: sigma-70 family RNA polymerase sigma factor [Bryobacteraceae bacterium]
MFGTGLDVNATTRSSDAVDVDRILRGLTSNQSAQAWSEFLELYSRVIFQIVRLFETDPDHIADCFVYVSEQLTAQQFRRLRKFNLTGPASFVTWLRVVVRRLCLDWRRNEFGRTRLFESIARLDLLDRELFRCVYQQGLSSNEAFLTLAPRFPALIHADLSHSLERIQRSLTSRQLWLLETFRPKVSSFADLRSGEETNLAEITADPAPDPEMLAAQRQERSALAAAIAKLDPFERLLVRLRFEQDLTLDQVAKLTGLSDAQTVDRRIRKTLNSLRVQLGKARSASV